jgi:hypothetical protein
MRSLIEVKYTILELKSELPLSSGWLAAVRQRAVEQFTRLGQIKMVARSLHLYTTSSTTEPAAATTPNGLRQIKDPKYFLIQILLKTPVPLWVPSCKSRNSSHQVVMGKKTSFSS